jgi:hypothetical protein
VIVKDLSAPAGTIWPKIRNRDTFDLKVVDFVERNGKYAGTLGTLVVEGPTGARGEVGSFQIPDAHRDLICSTGTLWSIRLPRSTQWRSRLLVCRGQERSLAGIPRGSIDR